MNRIRAIAAVAALLAAALPAHAQLATQDGMYGYANRTKGIIGRDAQTGGVALGTVLVDQNGQPITTSNRLPVDINATITATTMGQGTAGDPAASWYIRPGTGANLASESGGNLSTLVSGMGVPSTGPWSGSGDATQLSALKGIWNRGDAAATALGAPGDGAWSGSGSGSSVAVQKRLASLLANTATDVGLAPVASTSLEASHVLKAGPGQLFGFQANLLTCSQAPSPCWVMLLDRASAPSNGAVTPVKWYQLGSNGSLAASWPPGPPLKFANGITVACSSTGPFTFTATAQCAISGEVQ